MDYRVSKPIYLSALSEFANTVVAHTEQCIMNPGFVAELEDKIARVRAAIDPQQTLPTDSAEEQFRAEGYNECVRDVLAALDGKGGV